MKVSSRVSALDQKAMNYLPQRPNWRAVRWFFQVCSTICQGGAIWFVLALIVQFTAGLSELFLIVVAAEILQFVAVGMGLKAGIKRMRPGKTPAVYPGWRAWGDYSFPSGHAASSAVASIILIFYYPSLSWFWLCLAFACSWSRIYLAKHYLSDTLAGWLIGAAIGIFTIYFATLS